jgi:hypothetical protein
LHSDEWVELRGWGVHDSPKKMNFKKCTGRLRTGDFFQTIRVTCDEIMAACRAFYEGSVSVENKRENER